MKWSWQRIPWLLAISFTLWLAHISPALAAPVGGSRAIPAYRLTRWTLADGAPAGIRAIAQTPDGYLWLGTARGLYRFDGVSFERIEPERQRADRGLQIDALLARPDGSLLVGYDFGVLGVFRDGSLRDVITPKRIEGYVAQLVSGPNGGAWAVLQGTAMSWLGQLRAGRWEWRHAGESLPNEPGQSVLTTRAGETYLAMYPSVLRMDASGAGYHRMAATVSLGAKLLEDTDGHVWIVDEKSVRRLDNPAVTHPLPSMLFENQPRASAILRSGELWIGSDSGEMLRFAPRVGAQPLGPLPVAAMPGPVATGRDRALSIFEDREGNIWVGRATGLDRLTPGGPAIVAPKLELTTGFAKAGSDGALYVGARDGLYRLGHAGAAPTRVSGTSHQIYMLCGGSDGRLLAAEVDRTFVVTPAGAIQDVARNIDFTPQTCAMDYSGDFWLQKMGLFAFRSGHFVAAPASLGPQQRGRVLRPFGRGLMNYSTRGYIVRLEDGQAKPIWTRDQIATGYVTTMVPFEHGMLVAGTYGLAFFDGNRFSFLNARNYEFLTNLTGIAAAPDNTTWLIGATGIHRVSTVELKRAFAQPGRALAKQSFGREQGLQSRFRAVDTNDAAVDSDGSVWLNTNQGLAWVDPKALTRLRPAPNVIVRDLRAGGRNFLGSVSDVRLAPGQGDLQFDFTALGLTDASANRFRYKLEGRDQTWTDAGTRRQAFYTNIPPGRYVFHVTAANRDGRWNQVGAVLPFRIAPSFYQTWWFEVLVGLLTALILWSLYRYRLAVLGERIRQRIEGQTEERERIARELHDTFLQSLQGLVLRFQAIANRAPLGSDERRALEDALERSDDVLIEGRARVINLREAQPSSDLVRKIRDLLVSAETFELVGRSTAIRAPVVDEIVAIAREALENARRHAGATQIGIELAFQRADVTITVFDNGIGLDPNFAQNGRAGHFGIRGMRERAQQLRARLDLRSVPHGGTQVRLLVPARIARLPRPGPFKRWRRRVQATND